MVLVTSKNNSQAPVCAASRDGTQRRASKTIQAAAKACSDTFTPDRRALLVSGASLIVLPASAAVEQIGKVPDKAYTIYPDFTLDEETGVQYKDLEVGGGDKVVADGNSVVVDWAGVTVGYYGRIFEARNKSKGGSFTGDDKDYLRVKVGDPRLIPGFNEALLGMKVGGVRRVIVPASQGYPNQKAGFKGFLPAPGTFSGKRTLDFVLQNEGMMDKTLLFDIELLKIID